MNEKDVHAELYPRPNVHYYQAGDIECIDALRACLSLEEFRGYLKGNVIKYLWREAKKGQQKDDLGKAIVYLGWLDIATSKCTP